MGITKNKWSKGLPMTLKSAISCILTLYCCGYGLHGQTPEAGSVTKQEVLGLAVDGLLNKAHFLGKDGKVVTSWDFSRRPIGNPKLGSDGRVLVMSKALPWQREGGTANSECAIQIYSGDRNPTWTFTLVNEEGELHHDAAWLPNGNVLALIWEHRTAEQWLEAGADPDRINPEGCFVDAIWEIEPTGKQSGKVVWRWSAWDNLVQDRYPNLPTFGDRQKMKNRIPLILSRDRSSRSLADLSRIEYDQENKLIIVHSRVFQEVWGIGHDRRDTVGEKKEKSKEGGLAFRLGSQWAANDISVPIAVMDMALGKDTVGTAVLGCLTVRHQKGEEKAEQALQVFDLSELISGSPSQTHGELGVLPVRRIALGRQNVSDPDWVQGIGRGWGGCEWVLRFGRSDGFRGEGGVALQGSVPAGESDHDRKLAEKASAAGLSQLLSVSAKSPNSDPQ
jgi:hypothetical protein